MSKARDLGNLLDTGGDVVSGSLDNVSVDNSKISGMDASKLTGTVADARVSTLTASKLTGALPAISGANLTGIVAGPTVSASDPTINTNPSGGVGTQWANSTSGEMYVCTDATAGANIWTNVGAGSGNISPNDPPTNPTDDFPDTPGQSKTINHTFSGSTDPDGTVTYYKVDNISNSSLAVNTAEVAAGTAHVFTTGAVASDTAVTFRVRAKDNYGDYSSGTTVATEIQSYKYGGSNYGYHM
ncbi:MAG: hypothetical protein QGH83_09090, partial [Candidatus Pacebacteria bacterium]|nr:hypothetical protein [Candidatus Paceibacterota bacterium]